MQRYRIETTPVRILPREDGEGSFVYYQDVKMLDAQIIVLRSEKESLERRLEDSQASERMSAAKHEAVLAQAKAAEGRLQRLESLGTSDLWFYLFLEGRAREHGWGGDGSIADWLDMKLSQCASYRLRLNKLHEALREP